MRRCARRADRRSADHRRPPRTHARAAHTNDCFLARNGFIRPAKKLWKRSTEHRLRPACTRCSFRGHSVDECKVRSMGGVAAAAAGRQRSGD